MSRKMPGIGAAKRLHAANKRSGYPTFPRLSEIEEAAYARGFKAAKSAVKEIMRRSIEDPNGYSLRGEDVVRGLIDVMSELKPEVSSNG